MSDVVFAVAVVATLVGAVVASWGDGPGGRWWLAAPLVPLAVLVSVSWPTLVGLARPEDPAPGPTLRVAAQNVFRRNRHPDGTAAVLVRSGADVLVLSEVTPRFVDALDRAGAQRTYPYRLVRSRADSDGVAVYSRVPFRARAQRSRYTTDLRLEPPGAAPVDLVGVHLPSPTRVGTETWEEAYDHLEDLLGERGRGVVVAGDFNGNAALVPFRELVADEGLRDAQDVGGGGFRPTWSELTRIPPLLRLDHVLVGPATGVAGFDFLDRTGSDHRGVEATLRLRRLGP